MDDQADRAHRLARGRDRVHAGERAQSLEPGRHVRDAVGVQGARASVVPGVERSEQVPDLAAPALPHHQPVRPHPQRLPHQARQGQLPGPLDVRLPGLERHDVRMTHPQLGDVLDEHDALPRIRPGEQRAEQGRLPAAAGPGDQEVRAPSHRLLEQSAASGRERPRRVERVERRPRPRGEPDGEQRAARRHGWQHRVDAHPVTQPHVNARRRLVQMPPTLRGQPHGQRPHGRLTTEVDVGSALGAGSAVDPDLAVAVDEHVRRPGILRQMREGTERGRDPTQGRVRRGLDDAVRRETEDPADPRPPGVGRRDVPTSDVGRPGPWDEGRGGDDERTIARPRAARGPVPRVLPREDASTHDGCLPLDHARKRRRGRSPS
ncbi:hypothetical protein CMMCAS05_11900 [Clavibacter michiganensis subsp. michiganensis]|nr:hypothetical protein CMMCAS05_11900 [Clavibacter michiganensis subsp. michiganensis]